MRIIIAGSSGLIGTELVESLRSDGHEVIRLVRRKAVAPTEVSWDPSNQQLDVAALGKVDAIINLAGAGVGDHRWSNSYKKTILSSRVDTTSLLARIAAEINPEVFISASAIGWYGDTADRKVDETAQVGEGFLADVVSQWEAAADPARAAGIRVVHPRTGLVSSSNGGAWGKLLPLFKLGLGGKLGSGKQYWSFISMRDEVAALKYLLTNTSLSGPVNLTAPQPATNAQVTKAMAMAFNRPALAHVPAFALKLVLGEFSQEVLGSSRVIPQVLLDADFVFQDPNIESAMENLAGN
ncbi:MAG: TIGR01777 family oxidoreductase [Actinomycetes bacterium]